MKKVTMQEFAKAKRELMDLAYERYGHAIELYVEDNDPSELVTVNVNWAAIGTQTPEETKRFADDLAEAAELAAAFPYNGAKLANYETAEFWDDMFFVMEEEEQEEEEVHIDMADVDLPRVGDDVPSFCHGINAAEFNGREPEGAFRMHRDIPAAVEWAWQSEQTGDKLIVDVDGITYPTVAESVNWVLEGYGSALALQHDIDRQYAKTPSDIVTNINMIRIQQLLMDYNMVLDQLPDAPSKWAMANAWAYTIDQHLEEEEFVPEIGIEKPAWLERMLWAEGDFAGHHVTIIYYTI